MVITDIDSFLHYYGRIRQRTNRLLEVIKPQHMEWAYKRGKFTIADIIRHLAAIERFMYAENVQGNPSKYKGCGKELADGYDEVMSFYHTKHEESIEIFRSLSGEDLQSKCVTPGGTEITVWKWLRAMLEHEVHHRGELYIYLNLLDVTTPHLYGLSEEEVRERGQ